MENEADLTAPETQETENQDFIAEEPVKTRKIPWVNLLFLLGILVLFALYIDLAFLQKKTAEIPAAATFKKEGGLTHFPSKYTGSQSSRSSKKV
jgi:hypothetical protein